MMQYGLMFCTVYCSSNRIYIYTIHITELGFAMIHNRYKKTLRKVSREGAGSQDGSVDEDQRDMVFLDNGQCTTSID